MPITMLPIFTAIAQNRFPLCWLHLLEGEPMPIKDSHVVQGMKDAVAFARGDTTRGRVHIVARLDASDVVSIRMKTGLSPTEFARRYGFNLASLRSWEAGRRRPSGAARTLLLVLWSAPRAVARALAAAQNLAA